MPACQSTRCSSCGIGYCDPDRRPGGPCLDRSGPRRRRWRAEQAGYEYHGGGRCLGMLVTRSEYKKQFRTRPAPTGNAVN
jgi:hypothetical protein